MHAMVALAILAILAQNAQIGFWVTNHSYHQARLGHLSPQLQLAVCN